CRSLVFDENACSAVAARLFFSKIVVQQVRNACFSQKWLFPYPGTLVFNKNDCSAGAERLLWEK
ncbi:hypothetical protein, partial [Segatella oulorum]|uniref:hypothetical protein n=1 Tax=Segatella oulorum TaxID=28136 RepID=UPI0028ED623B